MMLSGAYVAECYSPSIDFLDGEGGGDPTWMSPLFGVYSLPTEPESEVLEADETVDATNLLYGEDEGAADLTYATCPFVFPTFSFPPSVSAFPPSPTSSWAPPSSPLSSSPLQPSTTQPMLPPSPTTPPLLVALRPPLLPPSTPTTPPPECFQTASQLFLPEFTPPPTLLPAHDARSSREPIDAAKATVVTDKGSRKGSRTAVSTTTATATRKINSRARASDQRACKRNWEAILQEVNLDNVRMLKGKWYWHLRAEKVRLQTGQNSLDSSAVGCTLSSQEILPSSSPTPPAGGTGTAVLPPRSRLGSLYHWIQTTK